MVANIGGTRLSESDREILIEREFDAPRTLVWRAFTMPEELAMWWGPTGFTTETESIDVTPGGQWRYIMRGPDGQTYPNTITYQEVQKPARLVYKHGGEVDNEPVNFVTEADFEEIAPERMRVRLRMTFPTKEAKDFVTREYGALEGAKQHMQGLAEHLDRAQSGRDDSGVLVIRRVLSAPVETVWDAWTDEKQLMAWFHPEAWKLTISEMDLRPGGAYFYRMSSAGMPDMYGIWHIKRVEAPTLLEFVVSFSDENQAIVRAPFADNWPLEVICTVTFEPHAGKGGGTVMTLRSEPINATPEEREAFKNGIGSMQQGWGQTLDSLVKHLS
ncbi:MAG: SRPBCC family protein [Phycisphaerales bacterium JB058]